MTAPPHAANILAKLKGVRRSGDGWEALCPAHEDRSPSLSVGIGDDGRVLVHCHAGCNTGTICRSLGITQSDLFPAPPTGNGKVRATIETTYDYCNESGTLLYQVVRMIPKSFRQRRPDGRGSWIWSLGDIRRVLYKLSGLNAADPAEWVLVPEGEKDANRLAELGFCSVTTSGGAGAWQKTDLSPLHGRKIALLGDNDGPGRQRVQDMAAELYGKADEVRIVEFPNLGPGGDLSDWVATFTNEETDVCDLLVERIAKARPYEPGSESASGPTAEKSEGLEWRPFPVDALPDPLAEFVSTTSEAIGCDPSYIALPLLGICGGAIGSSTAIRLKRSWRELPILWCALVGESGTLKSPAFRVVADLVRDRQRRIAAAHKQDCRENPLEAREQEEIPRLCVTDVTVESLSVLLEKNPRGLILLRDELSGWLGSFDRYAGTRGADASFWLSAHSGESICVDRKTSKPKSIFIPRAALSIAGGIQPAVLRRALGTQHRENGLLARLLLAYPPRPIKKWTDSDIPRSASERFDKILDGLYLLQPDESDDGQVYPHPIGLTIDGKQAWVRFYNSFAKEQANLTGDLAACASKLEGQVARFALIFHCVRVSAGDPTVGDPDRVDQLSIESGATLARWFLHEAKRVYLLLDGGAGTEGWLVDLIRDKGGRIKPYDLNRACRHFRTTADAEAALSDLVDRGMGQWRDNPIGPQGGRPGKMFVLKSNIGLSHTPTPDSATRGLQHETAKNGPNPHEFDGQDSFTSNQTPETGQSTAPNVINPRYEPPTGGLEVYNIQQSQPRVGEIPESDPGELPGFDPDEEPPAGLDEAGEPEADMEMIF